MERPIPADFEEAEATDQGVERTLVATEEFDFEGEPQTRTTKLCFLEDGGVHIVQKSQPGGLVDSLTLGENVAQRLRRELGGDS